MNTQVRMLDVAPVIPVRDLKAALDRYRALGFSVRQADEDHRYGFADWGPVSLHLTQWDEHDPARTGAAIYLYVSDADAVHAQWTNADVPGRLGEPTGTPYGLREFAYVDPDGTLHRVGSPGV
ncbi:bleomycin resistance protein [Actinomadura decatromicini]|uniref:Bleomycin resistance protein n=1 Tax=Actinomadura decatromicini TaxID=2604572 RepID=A0A5D3FHD6_9ACTN|nr:VOC family protein [Actinomadura decatromicini]TYK46705.1 VOC family protein [Actinomadura decatromicini]